MAQSPHPAGVPLTPADCWRILGQRGLTVWLSADGDGGLGDAVQELLLDRGFVCHRLSGGAGDANGAGRVARLMATVGVIALVALERPPEIDRLRERELHREAGIAFVEVPDAPPPTAEQLVARIVELARPDARAA